VSRRAHDPCGENHLCLQHRASRLQPRPDDFPVGPSWSAARGRRGTIGWRYGPGCRRVEVGRRAWQRRSRRWCCGGCGAAGRSRRCGDDSKPRPGRWHGPAWEPGCPGLAADRSRCDARVCRRPGFAADRSRCDGRVCRRPSVAADRSRCDGRVSRRSNLAAERRWRDGWSSRRTGHSPAGRRGDVGRWRQAATSVRCGCESDRRLVARVRCSALARHGSARRRLHGQRPVRLVARPDGRLCSAIYRIRLGLLCGARLFDPCPELPGWGRCPVHTRGQRADLHRNLRSGRQFLVSNRLRVPVARSVPSAGGVHTRMSRQQRLPDWHDLLPRGRQPSGSVPRFRKQGGRSLRCGR
jgi:hypothetical protein